MTTVAISASRTGASLCALQLQDGRVVTSGAAPTRGAQLTGAVAALLHEQGLDRSAIRSLRVDLGPGSYTGLRVAVTFARFASRFGGVTIDTLTSFELAAAMLHERGERGRVRLALDARRGRVHSSDLVLDDARVELSSPPAAITIDAFRASLDAGDRVFAETALDSWLESACAGAGADHAALPSYDAGTMFAPTLVPRRQKPVDLEPLYLMGSYAE